MPISIRNQNRSVRIPLRRLHRALQHLCVVLKVKHQDLNFLLVSDREIQRFNKKFLNHDYVTDVIAFGESEISSHLGDIVISTDTAKRQSREQGHSILTETKILAIHGLLHLLGYRDKKKSDREKMWKKTDALLARVQKI